MNLPEKKVMVLGRFAVVVYSAVLVVLMFFSVFSASKPGTITWGPTVDIWAATIAISHIEFGLGGGLGYRQLSYEMAKHVTSKGSDVDVNDVVTRELSGNPTRIDAALRAAVAYPANELTGSTMDKGSFVNTYAEDIGYADFYEMAFRLFGYSVYGTYYLYFFFLILTSAIFIADMRRSNLAISLYGLSISALFLMSTMSLFGDLLPHLASNRYLTTLTLIPFLHMVIASIDRRAFTLPRVGLLAAQALLFAIAITFRSSAIWMPLALLCVTLPSGISILRRIRVKHTDTLIAGDLRLARLKLWSMAGVIAFSAVLFPAARNAFLDEVYFKVALPKHMTWHSAVVGLTVHPDWPRNKPYADLPDGGDGAAFNWTEHVLQEAGRSNELTSSHVMNNYNVRLHESIMRRMYFGFIAAHPLYTYELFTFYKTNLMMTAFSDIFSTLKTTPLVIVLPLLALCGLLFLLGPAPYAVIMFAALLIFLVSLLPLYWAYAGWYVMAQQVWTSFMAMMVVPLALAGLLTQRLRGTRLSRPF